MTTTVMRDSRIGDAWIRETCAKIPVSRVMVKNAQTGQEQWNGNILTGPVRIAFAQGLLEMQPQMKSDPNSAKKYSCTILFPPYADLRIFWEEFTRVAQAEFPQHWNGQTWVGLDIPIFDAGMKQNLAGYTPGCMAMNTSSQVKPNVVDTRMNPITDPAMVYSGAWAIIAVNAYASGKGKPRKGPRFGIQGVMIIADDQSLAGSAPDPKTLFTGVNIMSPVNPAAGFGAVVTPPTGGPNFGAAATTAYYPQPQSAGAPAQPPANIPDVLKQFM